MILAPPLLDLICIRTLDLRLLCFCSHFVDQAMTCANMNLSDFVSSVAWPGMNEKLWCGNIPSMLSADFAAKIQSRSTGIKRWFHSRSSLFAEVDDYRIPDGTGST